MSILITSKKLSRCDTELAFKDIEEVHKIRGRILHYSSIVENSLKLNITKKVYNAQKHILKNKNGIKTFKNLDFNDRSKLFIAYLQNQNKYRNNPDFTKFKNDLNTLRKNYRNLWAHGFVYYQRFELDPKDNIYKPINFVKNNNKLIPIHFKSKHFNIANRVFLDIIKFLYENKFLKLNRFISS